MQESENEDQVYELEKRVEFWQKEAARNLKRSILIRDELVRFVEKYDKVAKELEDLKRRYDEK